MIFVDLYGGKKMFLYSFVRGTFFKNFKKMTISKIKDVSLQNDVVIECRMWMYSQLGHNEDERLFLDRIISTAKNAWDRCGQVLQDFASYFFSHYFSIIGTWYLIYSYYLVYIF